MATRFWVGGTGNWDATTTTNWSSATGGPSGASAPIAGDAVVFDANSGGGTVTPTSGIDNVAFLSITAGAFTSSGTLAFNTNNPNMTSGSVIWSGTGVRTINMGSGTWTLTATSGTLLDLSNSTSLTLTSSNANIVINGNSVNRTMSWGTGFSFASVTVGANTTKGLLQFIQAGTTTFGSLNVASGNTISFPQSGTQIISSALTITGVSTAPAGAIAVGAGVATLQVGAASTIDWGGILRITKSGAGSITATNSLDMGGNTNVTITGPSTAAGGGTTVVGMMGA